MKRLLSLARRPETELACFAAVVFALSFQAVWMFS